MRSTVPFLLIGVLPWTGAMAQMVEATPSTDMIWHAQPAANWIDGYPLGNGRIGAMMLGDATQQRFALNHTWLWRHMHKDDTNPDVAANLPGIRKLFFEGKIVEASNAANASLGVQPYTSPDPFQPAGDLMVRFEGQAEATAFRRELDLQSAVARMAYQRGGTRIHSEAFVSLADGVLALRLRGDKTGAFTCDLSLSRIEDPECTLTTWVDGTRFGFKGVFPEGVHFAIAAEALVSGGQTTPLPEGKAGLHLAGADEVTVLLSIETNQATDDPAGRCLKHIDAAKAVSGFNDLRARHVAAHTEQYTRVTLDLAGDDKSALPTDRRIELTREGQVDRDLETLFFNFGRYLLIAASQPGGNPANLQGIWSRALRPPWSADLHHDVNIQMNYWQAQVCGLDESAQPFFDYVERLYPGGRNAAQKLYGCRGLFVPLTNDVWGKCLKTEGKWAEWTGAAAWLAQHFWWQYEFTEDKDFLRTRAYPLLKDIALFYEDYLVPDSREDSPHKGKLVPVPSYSPENYFVGGVKPVSLCIGATMDLELIHEVLTNAIEASKILGVDEAKRATWRSILDQLPSLQIGKHGQLQEWLEDYEEGEPSHRHYSHLYAMFPGDQITIEDTPELAKAVRVSLERRLAAGAGGWGASNLWTAALWARMREGDKAHQYLYEVLAKQVLPNMLYTIRPGLYQIDVNCGATAILLEMLIQSHGGRIRLLPGLPTAWPEGEVRGLRARGGFEVDIAWHGGTLKSATIKSILGNTCRVAWPRPLHVVEEQGTPVQVSSAEGGISFPTERGASYVLTLDDTKKSN
jgi:alpha-L-fucosidase 2